MFSIFFLSVLVQKLASKLYTFTPRRQLGPPDSGHPTVVKLRRNTYQTTVNRLRYSVISPFCERDFL